MEVRGTEGDNVGLGDLGQLDAPCRGPGKNLGVDRGIQRRAEHAVDRAGGTGTDLAGEVRNKGLHIGLPQLRQLHMAESWGQVAADGGLIPNHRRRPLVNAVGTDPLVQPLCDRHARREGRVHERAPDKISLGQRQPPTGLRLRRERLGRRNAVGKPGLVPARWKPPNTAPLPSSSHRRSTCASDLSAGMTVKRVSDAPKMILRPHAARVGEASRIQPDYITA